MISVVATTEPLRLAESRASGTMFCQRQNAPTAGASAAAAVLAAPKNLVTPRSSSFSRLTSNSTRKMNEEPFPVKLYKMLEEAHDIGGQEVIGWSSCGKKFLVHQPKVFAETWMVRHFNQSKYKSFQRQLNLYNFHRQSRGKIKGVYSHHLFVRGNLDNVSKMKRVQGSTLSASAIAAARGMGDDSYNSTSSGNTHKMRQTDASFTTQELKQCMPLIPLTESPLKGLEANNGSRATATRYGQQQYTAPLSLFQPESLQEQPIPLNDHDYTPNTAQYLPLPFSPATKLTTAPVSARSVFDTTGDNAVVPQGFFATSSSLATSAPTSRITPSSSGAALFVADEDAESIGTIDEDDFNLGGLWEFHLQHSRGHQQWDRRMSLTPHAV